MPAATTVNDASWPSFRIWLAGCEVIDGPEDAGGCTFRTKFCVAFGAAPLLAVTVILNGAPEVFGGVPLNPPVILPSDAQGGSPLALNVGAGDPVATMVKLPGWPTVNVVLLALEIAGGTFTVNTAPLLVADP